jgi:hypothetical protein
MNTAFTTARGSLDVTGFMNPLRCTVGFRVKRNSLCQNANLRKQQFRGLLLIFEVSAATKSPTQLRAADQKSIVSL